MYVSTLLIISLLLISCTTTRTKFIEKPTPVFPPDILLQPCGKEEYSGEVWKDLVNYAIDLRSNLDKCNEDKKALRDWKDSNKAIK